MSDGILKLIDTALPLIVTAAATLLATWIGASIALKSQQRQQAMAIFVKARLEAYSALENALKDAALGVSPASAAAVFSAANAALLVASPSTADAVTCVANHVYEAKQGNPIVSAEYQIAHLQMIRAMREDLQSFPVPSPRSHPKRI